MSRNAARDEQVGENIHNIVSVKAVANAQRQTFPGVLINHRQKADLRSAGQTLRYEVISPDMIPPAGPQPDAGAVIQVKTATLLMFLRDFKSFLPPDPLNPFVINPPALYPQQRRNSLISIPAISSGQTNDVFR